MVVFGEPGDRADQSHCENHSGDNNPVFPGPLTKIIFILRRWRFCA
jgi:hypothetical protein